jgi:hypothetical protein
MKHLIQIFILLLPLLSFCQDETGEVDGSTYNIIYNYTKPKELKILDGVAYKLIKKDIISASDSVETRFIFLGEKNKNAIELAKLLTEQLRKGADFDSISQIHRFNKDQDISKDYTGWFSKGKKWPEYEQFCFSQDSNRIGWTVIDFGVIMIEILNKSNSKTTFEVPVYDFSKGFTGKVRDINDNKELISVSKWKNGLRSGISIEYWPNGKKKIEALYKAGEKWSFYREWFKNGQIKSEDLYNKGIWIESRLWNFNGKLISNTNNKNSIPIKFN